MTEYQHQAEFLPQLKFQYKSMRGGTVLNFQKRILMPVLGYKHIHQMKETFDASNDEKHQAVYAAVMHVRSRWSLMLGILKHAGYNNNVAASTWTTKVNCKPALVRVTPSTKTCGYVTTCPFCYARKCYDQWKDVQNIIPAAGKADRYFCMREKQFVFYPRSPEHMLELVEELISKTRYNVSYNTFESDVSKIDGWFRCMRLWLTDQTHGNPVLHVNTINMFANDKAVMPLRLTVPDETKKVTLKSRKSGVHKDEAWYCKNPDSTMLRKWFNNKLQYRAEWLTPTRDLSWTLSLFEFMRRHKLRHFYSGGIFQEKQKAIRSANEAVNSELLERFLEEARVRDVRRERYANQSADYLSSAEAVDPDITI